MRSTKILLRLMNLAALVSVIIIVVSLFRSMPSATIFDFHFTWVPIAYFFSALLELVFLVLLKLKGSDNRPIFWYMMYVIFSFIFLVSSGLETASVTIATYSFWYNLFEFASIIVSVIFLIFVLVYINQQDLLHRPLTWLSIFGAVFFLTPLASKGTLIYNVSKTIRYSYGYSDFAAHGSAYASSTLWSTAILLTGSILLILYYRQVRGVASKRNQVRLLLAGALMPLVIGLAGVELLPLLGINVPIIPFLGPFEVGIMGYALIHYKNFIIDPAAMTKTIMGTITDSVMTINMSHEIEYFNDASVHLLKIPPKTAHGKHISSLFHRETSRLILNNLNEDLQEYIKLDIPIDNKMVPIGLTTSKIISDGSLEGYVMVFRDISQEEAIKHDIERQVIERTKQLNDEHIRLQSAIDNLDVGLLMTFKDTETISYNAMLPKILLGHSHNHTEQNTLTLNKLEDKLQQSNFDLIKAINDTQERGKSFDIKEITYGKQILRIFGAPISYSSGKIIGTVVLVDNITEAKIQERSKDEFFSIASHELRTPLTSIKGNSSMIMQYYPNALKDRKLREMISDIHESSVRLIEVVNDFLDVSRLEQSKISFNYEAASLEEIIESIVYEMSAVMKEKKLYLKMNKLTLNRLPKVWVDKNRLKQVIYNLVGNSAKFTESGGITLSAELYKTNMIKLLVVDTGHGMTESSQQLLFHKFQQASSSLLTRDTTRGTGLGLYISKMIIEIMGGEIKLEQSIENVGTTFSITIPIDTPDHEKPKSSTGTLTDSATGLSVAK